MHKTSLPSSSSHHPAATLSATVNWISPLWVCFLTHYRKVCTGDWRFLPSKMLPDWMILHPTVYILQSLSKRKGKEGNKSWCALCLTLTPSEKLGAGCNHGTTHIETWEDWGCVIQERRKESKVMKVKVVVIIEMATLFSEHPQQTRYLIKCFTILSNAGIQSGPLG